jgi:hypothetical protein
MKGPLFIGLMMALVLLAGCVTPIAEVKDDAQIGETLTVKGTVQGAVKLGTFSGYLLQDKAGDTIGVVSQELPAEGDVVRQRGVVKKLPLLGYYLEAS